MTPPSGEPRIHAWAAAVPPFDVAAAECAQRRQDQLTKPQGSLGQLEALVVRIAGMTGHERPCADRRVVAVFAADHGVAAEGVSAYPATVTGQMLGALARGEAAVAILAEAANARLLVVDVGVVGKPTDHPRVLNRQIRSGTASFVAGPAMTRRQAMAAMDVGIDVVEAALAEGLDLLALGEVGIGNTTAAAAITACLLGVPPEMAVGRGTGVDDAGLGRKRLAVARALAANRPDPADPIGVLAAVGGLELAALVGAIVRAAAARIPVVLDGFVVGAAALLATTLCPTARSFLIAAHRSPEPGHQAILGALGLGPLLDLGLRLGEGSGAALALPLIGAALATHDRMATFAEAGVDAAVPS